MKQLAVWLVIFGSCCLSIRSAAQVAVPFKSKNGDSTQYRLYLAFGYPA